MRCSSLLLQSACSSSLHRLRAGASGISAYCASKWAVRGLLESLRLEVRCWVCCMLKALVCLTRACVQLLGTGVVIQMPCPTFTDTAMIREAQADTVRACTGCARICAEEALCTQTPALQQLFRETVPSMLSPAAVSATRASSCSPAHHLTPARAGGARHGGRRRLGCLRSQGC